ncbi:hypothetical protein NKH77_16205 [Streptomyces sp. M19]
MTSDGCGWTLGQRTTGRRRRRRRHGAVGGRDRGPRRRRRSGDPSPTPLPAPGTGPPTPCGGDPTRQQPHAARESGVRVPLHGPAAVHLQRPSDDPESRTTPARASRGEDRAARPVAAVPSESEEFT